MEITKITILNFLAKLFNVVDLSDIFYSIALYKKSIRLQGEKNKQVEDNLELLIKSFIDEDSTFKVFSFKVADIDVEISFEND